MNRTKYVNPMCRPSPSQLVLNKAVQKHHRHNYLCSLSNSLFGGKYPVRCLKSLLLPADRTNFISNSSTTAFIFKFTHWEFQVIQIERWIFENIGINVFCKLNWVAPIAILPDTKKCIWNWKIGQARFIWFWFRPWYFDP